MTVDRITWLHFNYPCLTCLLRFNTWDDSSFPEATVRLDRVTVMFNENGLEVPVLEAKDSVFSHNGKSPFTHGGTGAGPGRAFLDGCRFENNYGFGLYLSFGTVKNGTFLDDDDPTDALSDDDRDGQTALAEFHSRTDPADPQSGLRFQKITIWPGFPEPGSQTAYLIRNASPGLNYEVETSTDLREWRRAPQWGHPYNSVSGLNSLCLSLPADSPMVFFRLGARDTIFD